MSSNISLYVVLPTIPDGITILFFEDAFLNARYLQMTLINHYSLTSKPRERVGNISIFYYSSCADFQHVRYHPSSTFRVSVCSVDKKNFRATLHHSHISTQQIAYKVIVLYIWLQNSLANQAIIVRFSLTSRSSLVRLSLCFRSLFVSRSRT